MADREELKKKFGDSNQKAYQERVDERISQKEYEAASTTKSTPFTPSLRSV